MGYTDHRIDIQPLFFGIHAKGTYMLIITDLGILVNIEGHMLIISR